MRMVTKTRDYYDSLINFNSDDKNVFVRERKTIEVSIPNFRTEPILLHDDNYNYSFSHGVVGFCGEIHTYTHIRKSNKIYGAGGDLNTVVYTSDDFYSIVGREPLKSDSSKMRYIRDGDLHISSWLDEGLYASGFMFDTMKTAVADIKEIKSIFLDNQVAYFNIDHSKYEYRTGNVDVTLYPMLKHLCFYKVHDIHATYQKLEYYLNNELAKPDDPYIEPVSDKIKAESRGFDEFSFRKEKSK